jgi:hypothetical protein
LQPLSNVFKQNPSANCCPLNSIGTHRWSAMHSLSALHGMHVPTESVGVVVHVFVAGSHELPPQGPSSSTVHSTHTPTWPLVSQTVVPLR